MGNPDSEQNTNDLEARVSQQEEEIQQLRKTVKRMMPSRRGVVQGGAAAAAAGIFGYNTGKAKAAGLGDGDTQWGSNSNRDDYVADHVDANSAKIDQARINSSRPTRLASDKMVTVGSSGDYASIQTAVKNELPYWVEEGATFTLDIADGTYNEDVMISAVNGSNNGAVKIKGNSTTPSNVQIDTITVTGCRAHVDIDGIELISEPTPIQADEDASMMWHMCHWGGIGNINFRNSTNGVYAYATHELAVRSADFGSGVLAGNAFTTKHWGRILADVNSTVTGNVGGRAYRATNGTIIFDSSNDLTGDTGLFGTGAGRGWLLDQNDLMFYGPEYVNNLLEPGQAYDYQQATTIDPPSGTSSTSYEKVGVFPVGLPDKTRPNNVTAYGRLRARFRVDSPSSSGDQAYLRTAADGVGVSPVTLTETEIATDSTSYVNVDSGWVELTSLAGDDYGLVELEGKVDSGTLNVSSRLIDFTIDWRLN